MKELLLIDDDESTLLIVSKYLNKSGYKTHNAKNGQDAVNILKTEHNISLIIVDVVMPVMDGVEFCRFVRDNKDYRHIPILMLTAMSDITDKFMGFDAGADDYLTKPFEPLELLLRVQALLKRTRIITAEIASDKKLDSLIKINNETFSVNIKGKEIYLTSVEFDILCYLYLHTGKPIAVEELLQKVMNYPPKTGNPETIRTHIKNIRAKIEESDEPKYITTVPKRGYMFNNIV
jgi:two-component system alkaline phosphatase synthesis response regulator PhoP